MEVFERRAEENYARKLERYLRAYHGEALQVYNDEHIAPMITNGITRARRNGLTFENKIAFFVALMFEIAPNFDEHPRIQRILQAPGASPNMQIDLLTDLIIDKEWREARSRYDAAAWGPIGEDDR
jgi:hypothetical protein